MIGLIIHAPTATRLLAEISAERLRELQRFAELGRVSAGLIHDISSPLTAAILHLEQEESRGVHSIRHARRSIRVLERYVEAARQQLRQESRNINFCVKEQLRQVRRVVLPTANKQHVRLYFEVNKKHRLIGDPIKFQQIMTNLIINSIDAYSGCRATTHEPTVRITVNACCKWLRIRVHDRGNGITTGQMPYLFEPFYSTKNPNATSGLGIGLSTVKHHVEKDFGGEISVSSTIDNGTEFNIKLRRISPKSNGC